tara:strand:+ start:311 stop:604 length:294 start_codon:yes stop_codon:yes gene_type:complete
MKQPAKSVKQRIIDYVRRRPEDTIYHPTEVSQGLGVNVGHTRSVMKELVDDGFLIAVQEDSAHKNKYFFALRKQGIDPSIVSRPPIKKGRYYGKVIT